MTERAHRSILERLRRPGSPRLLALVRLAMGLHLTTVFASPAVPLLSQIGGHPHPMTATYFPAALEALIASHAVELSLVGATASMAMAIGLATRFMVPLVLVLFLATQNFWFRSTLFHDDWLYFTFPLLVLSFARPADVWSADAWILRRWRSAKSSNPPEVDARQYRWPVEAVVLWFAFVYVSAGIAKLFPIQKGLVWITGISAQEFAVQFVRDSPAFWMLGEAPFDFEQRWPFTIAAVGTVLVELSAGALLFTHRYRLPLFLAILGLHISIFMMGIPGFPQMALALGVALVPPHYLRDVPAGDHPAPPRT